MLRRSLTPRNSSHIHYQILSLQRRQQTSQSSAAPSKKPFTPKRPSPSSSQPSPSSSLLQQLKRQEQYKKRHNAPSNTNRRRASPPSQRRTNDNNPNNSARQISIPQPSAQPFAAGGGKGKQKSKSKSSPFLKSSTKPTKSLSEWYKSRTTNTNNTNNSNTNRPFPARGGGGGGGGAPPRGDDPSSSLLNNESSDSLHGLRNVFLKSLETNRAARRSAVGRVAATSTSTTAVTLTNATANVNTNNNPATVASIVAEADGESRLEKLLRMSRELPKAPPSSQQKISGVKAFRQARKQEQMKQRQQQEEGQYGQGGQGGGYQRGEQGGYQRNGGGRGGGGGYYEQRNRSYEKELELKHLQVELMKQNDQSQGLYKGLGSKNNKNNSTAADDKRVQLPSQPMTLLQLSTTFRVSTRKLQRTLRSLGEWNPKLEPKSDGSIPLKIDLDVAELVALELGLDPQRSTRGMNPVELAERRMLRQEEMDDVNANNGGEEEADHGDAVATMDYSEYASRPPVVCIMGHVDHGKTTLMDCLRRKAQEAQNAMSSNLNTKKKKVKKSKKKKKKNNAEETDGIVNVAGTEAGGITQVVSAFQIQLPGTDGGEVDTGVDAVTFLDTPGHAAFKAMRQSGSNGADVIVLVIASDDGVSPQTREILEMYKSIARAQQGSISLMIAMTKIDKPGIDVDQSMMNIENQLMEEGIFTERMALEGCEFDPVQLVPVSGLSGDGVEDLIERLALQSEIMDLRADPEARAEGLVIDAKMEKGLGVVVDCIVRWGTLNVGDYIVSGIHGGKVRILNDVNNKSIKKASPSQPVRIVGLKTLPKAGEPIVCVQCEEMAKEIITQREGLLDSNSEGTSQFRAEDSKEPLDLQISGCASKGGFMSDNVFRKYGREAHQEGQDDTDSSDAQIRIPVILKADADGTLAALRDTVLAIKDESTLDLLIDPVSLSIGQVTASDVRMAVECDAAIFCFNLKGAKDKAAMSLAISEDVEIRNHNVIYHLLDEAKDVFAKYIPPTMTEKVHGSAKVKAVFDINNTVNAERIAGLIVEEGELYLDKVGSGKDAINCEYRIKRRGKVITSATTELKAKSLRKVKEEVEKVRRGEECGLNLESYTDYEEGDIIECFSVEMKRTFV